MILFNSEYAFLIGAQDPASGWIKVPQGLQRGGPWVEVSNKELIGFPYFRQSLPDPEITPEGFAVKVGDTWASSIQTYDWVKISLVTVIREDLPAVIKPIFPYRLLTGQLVRSQDQYITLVVHERFHAFQGLMAEEKFSASEQANMDLQDDYPWFDEAMVADWKTELELLAEALQTDDPETALDLARRFLAQREARRNQANLTADLIQLEQQREWIEGLARYVELTIWEQAAFSEYSGIPETDQLSDFNHYKKFESRWEAELKQFPLMADDEGDGRFYYSGMAQAKLLDRFMPDWKQHYFEDGVWLDDLLAQAVNTP